MKSCPACSRDSASDGRFCPWCASPLDVTSAETAVLPVAGPGSGTGSGSNPRSGPRSVSGLNSSAAVDEGRFLPGTVLAGRYRISGLLGRGGMGEVYRASDLVLGQAVALKFLPESMSRDERSLVRFYNEVRIARQVTHPNVCRVYDIGEVDGLHYISMEFVDGEDMASLLRRIGRLPAAKATEVARQLCAGLAAAHEKGVLHRDLKPANTMIDGRGQVIIMDFGLAGLAEQLQGDVRSGTPAYMSPEQLAGREVTARSDIYSLGLVLYELYAGKRAFQAASLVELVQMQEQAAPTSLTSLAGDLDPAVERVVLRCLQPDPRQRPASALAVSAALPGGDPLAAALAAGETPSPDLVAAAGETEGLAPRAALGWLAAALVGILVVGIWGAMLGINARVPVDVPPQALARDARNLLKSFGYTARPGDHAFGFGYPNTYLSYLRSHSATAAERWKNPAVGMPPLILFWYRESPERMVAVRHFETSVSYYDPPQENSGTVRLETDTEGRLVRMEVVPPEMEEPPKSPPPPFEWSLLFRAAGIDQSRFQPAEPKWTPLANWDARAAWTGTDPQTKVPLRVEAAQWRGRPVSFQTIGPWTRPERTQSSISGQRLAILALIYTGLLVCGLIAWRNIRTRRADVRGATLLALFYGGCMVSSRFLEAHHSPSLDELNVFWKSIAVSLINAAVVWGFYVALEPWVRRKWPHAMISWSRYTTKGIRDPLVGRDLLFGAALACGAALLPLAQAQLHGVRAEPLLPELGALTGLRFALGAGLAGLSGSIFNPLFMFFILFLGRMLLRREWLAILGFVAVMTLVGNAGTAFPWIDIPAAALAASLVCFVLLRFGLLALMATQATAQFLLGLPRTLDASQWYFALGIAPLLTVALVAYYGFRISLGGRPLWKGDLT